MSTAGILQAYLPLGEKFAKSWYVIIISAIKSYSNNMLVSLAANSDVRRQGPGMHHTICWLSVVSCPLKKTGNILGESDMDRTGFENLRVYQLAEEIADLTWEVVIKWNRLSQYTLGKQPPRD